MGQERQKGNVLVVDDDRDLRDMVAALLEASGFSVTCAENGAQALALMQRRRPGAVVMDLSMPVMTGWELIDVVRRDGELSRVPLVVLSSMTAPDGVPRLPKPVQAYDLVTTVERICRACAA